MNEDDLEHVREKARDCVCHTCGEDVVVHDGSHLTTQNLVLAIADAVEHANRHPSNNERDGDIVYVTEDGYYPDEKDHFVDLSEVPEDLRHSASIDVMSHLAKRGLAINSVRWSPPRLHVMAPDDMGFGYYGNDLFVVGHPPESYPTETLGELVEAAIQRYRGAMVEWGRGDQWKQCDPEDLRSRSRENLVCDEVPDKDYADALNYLLMARESRDHQAGDADGGETDA